MPVSFLYLKLTKEPLFLIVLKVSIQYESILASLRLLFCELFLFQKWVQIIENLCEFAVVFTIAFLFLLFSF